MFFHSESCTVSTVTSDVLEAVKHFQDDIGLLAQPLTYAEARTRANMQTVVGGAFHQHQPLDFLSP